MKEREDMQIFTYEHNRYTFRFRLLDTNIKTTDGGKHFNFIVPVTEKDNKVKEFIVSFRVPADEIDTVYSKVIDGIIKHINK